MKFRSTLSLTVVPLGVALLVGCGQFTRPVASTVERPAFVMQVDVTSNDTEASVAAQYGGRVFSFDAAQGYAIVGFDAQQKTVAERRVRALDLEGALDANVDTFKGGMAVRMNGTVGLWSGGTVGLWSGGTVGLWSGGTVGLWSGGMYNAVPENSAAFSRINLDDAHLTFAKNLGRGVKVAVIDTGLDLSHPAFATSLAPSFEWRDYVDGDGIPQEGGTEADAGYGHGTAVAGIILQVAPNAQILPIRVLGSNGGGDALNVALAIDYAVARGARVINLSLGSSSNIDVVKQAIERATRAGRIVVASAGNDNRAAITFPAQLTTSGAISQYGISVGSVDLQDKKSSFSNYMKDRLEMVAPGEAIFTTYPGARRAGWSGTSMAAPIVAGGVALALGQTLKVDVKDVAKNVIEKSADLYNNNQNSLYKDMLGKGRIDLKEFLANTVSY